MLPLSFKKLTAEHPNVWYLCDVYEDYAYVTLSRSVRFNHREVAWDCYYYVRLEVGVIMRAVDPAGFLPQDLSFVNKMSAC